jgi:molybdenum ABC transporter molybdate-binding protein
MQRIASDFERASGHRLKLSFGGTGKLYAQIANGAPFDVLLSADDETPARLEKEGLGVAGSRFTYATGRLVLWSPVDGRSMAKARCCATRASGISPSPIRKPPLRPGSHRDAAGHGLLGSLQGKFVQGENIAQAFQFVQTGNAELGFVALSQVWKDGRLASGSAGSSRPASTSPFARMPFCSAVPAAIPLPAPCSTTCAVRQAARRSRPTATTCTKSTNNTNQSRNKFGTRPGTGPPCRPHISQISGV